MRPEDVGLSRTESGAGQAQRPTCLPRAREGTGLNHLDDQQLQSVFEKFKALADSKKTVYDADIEALAESVMHDGPALWTLESFHTSAGTGTLPTAAVVLRHADGRRMQDAAIGDGPVDALFKAIENITGIAVQLRDYQVRSVSVGEDGQGESSIEAEVEGRTYRGRGISTDIVEATPWLLCRWSTG